MARKGTPVARAPPRDLEVECKVHIEFYTSGYEGHKDRNPTPIPGTCTWILNHRKFQDWQLAQFSSLLWLSADPGCGKSVLISFLVNRGEELVSGKNICYFFFKVDNDEQGDPVNALCAILHQIYTAQPELIKHAIKQLNIKGNNVRNLDTLWNIFTTTIEDPNSHDTICFIDAIDECERSSRKGLIQRISNYFTTRSKGVHGPPYLKMMIASRPDNLIKTAFDKHQPILESRSKSADCSQSRLEQLRKTSSEGAVSIIRLRGEDETDAITRDVELVVKAAIDDLTLEGLPADLLSDLQKEIIQYADRTFLWTTLIIDLLKERSEAGASRRELNSILCNRNIDDIYAVLLEEQKSPVQARKVLSIILAATQPLLLEELNVALAIVPDHYTFTKSSNPRRPQLGSLDEVALDLIYPFENYLKSLCGHFLRIIKGKVYLVHQTAREYLLQTAKTSSKMNEDFMFFAADEEDQGIKTDSRLIMPAHLSNSLSTNLDKSQTIQGGRNSDGEAGNVPGPSTTLKHSFTLKTSHALLLEICVTYLYSVGREAKRGDFNPYHFRELAVGRFIDYATKFWTVHFQKVCSKIPHNALAYYHGLCHPMFPGFDTWMSIRDPNRITSFDLSLDETQDYYLYKFGLLGTESIDFEDDSEDDDDDFYGDEEGIAISGNLTKPQRGHHAPLRLEDLTLSRLSSHPAALNNHNFPLEVDITGFVSLQKCKTGTQDKSL